MGPLRTTMFLIKTTLIITKIQTLQHIAHNKFFPSLFSVVNFNYLYEINSTLPMPKHTTCIFIFFLSFLETATTWAEWLALFKELRAIQKTKTKKSFHTFQTICSSLCYKYFTCKKDLFFPSQQTFTFLSCLPMLKKQKRHFRGIYQVLHYAQYELMSVCYYSYGNK